MYFELCSSPAVLGKWVSVPPMLYPRGRATQNMLGREPSSCSRSYFFLVCLFMTTFFGFGWLTTKTAKLMKMLDLIAELNYILKLKYLDCFCVDSDSFWTKNIYLLLLTKKYLKSLLCMWMFACMYACVAHVYLVQAESRRGIRITSGCESPDRFSELNLGPLQNSRTVSLIFLLLVWKSYFFFYPQKSWF